MTEIQVNTPSVIDILACPACGKPNSVMGTDTEFWLKPLRETPVSLRVEIVEEQGADEFETVLQQRLDQGWNVIGFTCTNAHEGDFWYIALVTRASANKNRGS